MDSKLRKILFHADSSVVIPGKEILIRKNQAIGEIINHPADLLLHPLKLTGERFKQLVSCIKPQPINSATLPYIVMSISNQEYNQLLSWKQTQRPNWLRIEFLAGDNIMPRFVIYTEIIPRTNADDIEYFFKKVLTI